MLTLAWLWFQSRLWYHNRNDHRRHGSTDSWPWRRICRSHWGKDCCCRRCPHSPPRLWPSDWSFSGPKEVWAPTCRPKRPPLSWSRWLSYNATSDRSARPPSPPMASARTKQGCQRRNANKTLAWSILAPTPSYAEFRAKTRTSARFESKDLAILVKSGIHRFRRSYLKNSEK